VIARLLRSGFLHQLHRGVYAVGHLALPQYAREQAALLAAGESSLISHGSALWLWGLINAPPADVHVTVVDGWRRKRPGIRLHRVAAIDDGHIRTRHGIRTTSPARALIEYAADAPAQALEDAVAEARTTPLLRGGELEKVLARVGRMRGAAAMRAFLREEAGPGITRSHAERRFRKMLREARLPQPLTNVHIAGEEADFVWPEHKVILEVDSYQFHGHRRAFENDRRKDMVWADAGYHVIRITWRQFTGEPLALIAHIARALDRSSRSRAAH
jgi:very-short-patch-repair endonuclease